MDVPTSPEPVSPDEVARLRARIADLEAALAATARAGDAPPADARPGLAPGEGDRPAVASGLSAEALLDTLFVRAPIGLAFLDTDLRFVRINATLAEINGPSPEEHIGRSVDELLPDLAPQVTPIYRHVLATGESVRDQEVHGTTPGAPDQPRDWLSSYYPVMGADGRIIGLGVVVVEITERKQAEAALARQAATLREQAALLDLAHVLIREPGGRIIFWNRGAEELYGWSSDEAVGRVSHELFQTRFPVSLEKLQDELATRGEWEGELVHRRKDGAEIVVASHQVLARDDAGRPLSIVEVNNDITALRRAERELRERQEQLMLAHDAAELGAWWHDRGTNRVRLDARAQAHFGFTQGVVDLADVLLRVHPDDIGRLHGELAATAEPQDNGRYLAEYRVVHPDGTVHWLAVRARVYGTGWGAPDASAFGTGTSQDITARKLIEEEARRAADRLHMLHTIDRAILVAESPERIAGIVVSQLQRLLSADRVAVIAYDAERQRIRRLAITDVHGSRLAGPDVLPLEPADLLPPFALGQPWYVPDTELAPPMAPRAIPHRAIGFRSLVHLPLVAEGELLGALRLGKERPGAFDEADITIAGEVANQLAVVLRGARMRAQLEEERALLARRVAERTADLRNANLELARAARLKDEFLANMSHELRTPLNAILGRSELLREQIYGPLTEEQDGALVSIEEAGQHLLELINDILDLSKVEAGMLKIERAPLAVDALGQAAIRMVAEAAGAKRVALSSTYDSRVQSMLADERRLKQILVNLLSNAVKFTPPGGKVGLEVAGDLDQQVVTFTVWDTGIGIAHEDQLRVFQPFVQASSALDREQTGTGLGLALVQRLTELHGGSITLESEVGAGTNMRVVLPWERPEHSDEPAPSAAPPAAQSALPRRALVIDDSPSAVAQIALFLRELGSDVIVHERAEGAVEQAAAAQPDLIVLDILLPGASGWEVLRQLKADPRTEAIPIIVVSVVDDVASARALGAAAALLKPVARDTFVQALRGLRPRAGSAEEATVHLALLVAPEETQVPLVLIAEDNEENVRMLQDYLTAVGFRPVAAQTGAEAVVMAEEHRPDLILMDVQMPVMDGLEAMRRIRAAGIHDTPIIALTALAMRGDRERCLEAGANEYLTKPVRLRALREAIDRLLKGR